MITDYTTLQAAVATWLSRDGLTAYIPDFVRFGELYLNRTLRCRGNDTLTYLNMLDGYPILTLPSDFQELRSLSLGLYGGDAVTNGSFTGNATGWTLGAGWAYGTNNAAKGTDGVGTLSQALTLDYAYRTYEVAFTVSGLSVAGFTPSLGGLAGTAISANGTYRQYIIPATTAATLAFTPSPTGSRFTLDDISVRSCQFPQGMGSLEFRGIGMENEWSAGSYGPPGYYSIQGSQIRVSPIPNQEYIFQISYWANFPQLTGTVTTNWLTANAPDAILLASLVGAESFLMDDPRIGIWKTLLGEIVAGLNSPRNYVGTATPIESRGNSYVV